ncbi:hypothetical protein CEX98_05120 [Pseudoalteromonas piscicida]|uniref:Uncharacterized protein n=1 Tax=Pseudoalteromonas piscicida TaxID=43662 RepID=A0A2A5JTJ6_PSEO7|nr:hypothetical protein CEX98_05120 [Pseudoalteromonas piscicida]
MLSVLSTFGFNLVTCAFWIVKSRGCSDAKQLNGIKEVAVIAVPKDKKVLRFKRLAFIIILLYKIMPEIWRIGNYIILQHLVIEI